MRLGRAELVEADLLPSYSLVSSVKDVAEQLKVKTGGELQYVAFPLPSAVPSTDPRPHFPATSSPPKVSRACPFGGTPLTCSACAGGPPNGGFSLTPEGHESHFAVQLLSRFGLAYLLAKSGTLKDSWVTICAPGGEKASPPDLEDLELKSEQERARFLPMRIVKTGTRDGAVMDGLVAVS